MTTLNLALIGNCGHSALIDRNGRFVWSCIPRIDGDPVFCSLINGEVTEDSFGFYDIDVLDFSHSEQCYIENTAVVKTTLFDTHGASVEIMDFAPRFKQYERTYRPIMSVRRIRAANGHPRIRVRVRPAIDYGSARASTTFGSNHIRYVMPAQTLRLNTNIPVSYVLDEVPFILDEEYSLILGPDETLNSGISETSREFFERTCNYWRDWSRSLSIPFEWQEEVIRAAITLKLCAYEETGAIVAAMTTSIPEAAGSERNWDYRYCWLRDSYFVVHALNRLGATKTMEEYIRYISNIAASVTNGHAQPVYGIAMEQELTERIEGSLSGYRDTGPVRVGNQAYQHIQNDVYGAVVMSIAQASHWQERADTIERTVHEKAWNEERNSFVESFGDGDQVDASLLLLNELGFLAADDPKFAGTVAAVEQDLRIGDFLYRYVARDDFGIPETSFTICTFWYISALAALGREEEARRLFENLLACRNHVGLLSEDVDPDSRELWGNFPQTYSMVGLISCAMRLSTSWESAY